MRREPIRRWLALGVALLACVRRLLSSTTTSRPAAVPQDEPGERFQATGAASDLVIARTDVSSTTTGVASNYLSQLQGRELDLGALRVQLTRSVSAAGHATGHALIGRTGTTVFVTVADLSTTASRTDAATMVRATDTHQVSAGNGALPGSPSYRSTAVLARS